MNTNLTLRCRLITVSMSIALAFLTPRLLILLLTDILFQTGTNASNNLVIVDSSINSDMPRATAAALSA